MTTRPTVIRFFGEWGGESPLWIDGLVSPDSLGLSEDLCQRLESWADLYSENMTEDGWPAGPARTEYERSGRELADELARVLGNEFEIEYHALDTFRRRDAVIFRSRHEALDPGAAEVAHQYVADATTGG